MFILNIMTWPAKRILSALHTSLWSAALLAGAAAAVQAASPPTIRIDRDNLVITRSVRVQPGRYVVADKDGNGVLQIGADNVVVDFGGARLLSCPDPEKADREKFSGIGVNVRGHRGVVLKNAVVQGFGCNIKVQDASRVTIKNCDVNFSRAQRLLQSGTPVDSFLNIRDVRAWRGYGAGIWLENAVDSAVTGCRGSGAQDGLILVNSRRCSVRENDFSFNSAFGIGLYGSSDNVVCWNRADFVNRPWGGGWGGDSAGMAVVNGSNGNFIVGNSLTHGGDGFFLTDRVNGGYDDRDKAFHIDGSCNDNVVADNDGSWSPNNAFEGTFSRRNVYIGNRAEDSGYGFWLGFADASSIFDNDIRGNRALGVAIPQGAGSRIEGNRFAGNGQAAVALWADTGPGLAAHPSTDTRIVDNLVSDSPLAFDLTRSTSYTLRGNTLRRAPLPAGQDAAPGPALPSAKGAFLLSAQGRRLRHILSARPPDFRFGRETGGPQGVGWLQPDEYGPRDFRGHLFAWRRVDAGTIEVQGLQPGTLRATAPDWLYSAADPAHPQALRFEAKLGPGAPGETRDADISFVSPGGRQETLHGSFLLTAWDVRWYRWGTASHPPLTYTDRAGWDALFAGDPAARERVREVVVDSGAPTRLPAGLTLDHVAFVATTKIRLDGGTYKFATASDDGIRLLLDGKEIISRWNHHGPTPDETTQPVTGGVHTLEVQYCQEDGAAALRVQWTRQP